VRVIPLPRAWTHLAFAAALWRDRPDVTFVPAHTLPVAFPGRAVVTVHDLGYKYFPEAHPPRDRRYLDLTTRYSAWRATRVLADSAATAADLTRFYGTPPGKIRVVYPGVEPLSVRGGDIIRRVREKYGLPERYFLFVGTLQPRKNIARLAAAYARYRVAAGDSAAGLVLAGTPGWLYDPAWVAGINGIVQAGYIDEVDKPALYAGAVALVFPSLYEGFGFPVLEAMHTGTPVIAARTSSLPELAGEAGLLVDPLDVDAIARAMRQIDDDPALYLALQTRGYVQAGGFTWERAAAAALAALEEAARPAPA
jgi:glycosyltransferase involved in cell wall biosynthesis